MSVVMHGNCRSHPPAHLAHQEFRSLGTTSASRVHDNDLAGSRLQGGEIDFPQEFEFRTRPVHRKVGDCDAILLCVADGVCNAFEDLVSRNAIGLQLDIAGGRFDDRRA